jgi:tRNA nucleotidyltransferase/poly(A) polymerase
MERMYRPHALDSKLASVLPPGSLYAVGGRVRDEVRAVLEGAEPEAKDLDYVVTRVPIEELQARLAPLGRLDVVGAAFAVIKLTVDGVTVDIALPRRERSLGHGHRDFEVQSGPDIPLAEDLARRDFRMNMLARALPAGDLIDPHGGEADIRAKRIDILTPRTFEEDPLRMLRAAQFAARFEYAPTAETRTAMQAAAPLVQTVSAERVYDELAKLFTKARRPSIGLELLRETGVLRYLWPELLEGVGVEQNEWHAYDVWNHSMRTLDATPPGDLVLRLAALFHDVAKPRTKEGPHFYRHEIVGSELVESMLERFRFPSDVVKATAHLVRSHMFSADPEMKDATLRRFIRRIGVNNIEHLFDLRAADVAGSGLPKRGDHNERFLQRVREEIARKPAFSVADLHVGGDDVIAALVARGEAPPDFRGDERVGTALRWLFEQVTDVPERNERISLLQLLNEYLDTQTLVAHHRTRQSKGRRR